MTIPVGPPPRSWHAALFHPGIENIVKYPEFKDSGDADTLVTLRDGWLHGGDLDRFWVVSLQDLREQWQDIQPVAPIIPTAP